MPELESWRIGGLRALLRTGDAEDARQPLGSEVAGRRRKGAGRDAVAGLGEERARCPASRLKFISAKIL